MISLAEVVEQSGQLRINPDAQRYFDVHLKKGFLSLRARGVVGYIPLTDKIVVQVQPRVPVANLSRVIQVSAVPPTPLTSMRTYATTDDWNETLLDLYAKALIHQVRLVFSTGILRDYVRREALTSFPHGRVLHNQSLQKLRSRGIRHAVSASWFERTPDNAPNRCLKYALWLLCRRYMSLRSPGADSRRLHRTLNGLYAGFDGVELDHSRRFMQDGSVQGSKPLPASRPYYRDALNVALAAIQQRTILIEDATGPLRMPSVVLDMNVVFEAYVRNVLREHAVSASWQARVLDGNEAGRKDLYNAKPSPPATPDVVIRPHAGPPLIIEIKNVPVGGASARDAVHQAITYALSYRADRVILVHPRGRTGPSSGMSYVGDVDHVSVYQYRFDLGSGDLDAEAWRFGAAVGDLLPGVSPHADAAS
jgi:5-methylcytosine-specific restriction enzyme subunit McrC